MVYKVFLAWQSQDKEAGDFIKSQLVLVKQHIKDSNNLDIDIVMYPTQEESGSPNVINSIWSQIKESDVFVGDLSHICEVCELNDITQVSNSNVMYEVGIADSFLGESRTILLCSQKSNIKKLAFDINHKRISRFNIKNRKFYEDLSEWIMMAIRESVNQKFYKRYICKELLALLEVVYNNCFRMIYSDFSVYPDNFNNISKDAIAKKLKNGIYNAFQVKVNYAPLITRLEKGIKELYCLHDEKLTNLLIEATKSVETYQFINYKSRFNQFQRVKDYDDLEYQACDKNSFYLQNIENANPYYRGNYYFRDDLMFLSCMAQRDYLFSMFHQDTIAETYASECKFSIKNNMTQGTIFHYRFIENSNIDKYAQSILSIIIAINNLLDYLKLYIDTYVEEGKKANIIAFSEMIID